MPNVLSSLYDMGDKAAMLYLLFCKKVDADGVLNVVVKQLAAETKLSRTSIYKYTNGFIQSGLARKVLPSDLNTNVNTSVNTSVNTAFYLQLIGIQRSYKKSTFWNEHSCEHSREHSREHEKDTQFEELWNAYGHKGSKKQSLIKWLKLTDDEREKVMRHAPLYRATRVTQYAKDLQAYLNQRIWESAITTNYNVVIDPDNRASQVFSDERLFGFLDIYNGIIKGTRLTRVEKLTEDRRVLLNITLSYCEWDKIKKAIEKAATDPYVSGALPLTPGRRIPTFEEIMNPNNILKSQE